MSPNPIRKTKICIFTHINIELWPIHKKQKKKKLIKHFERHIGMNRIKARFWFSVTQPSVPSARRQTSSEISWSRSRWPVSDPTMFRSSCSLWSPASLKQHQQTRYTRVIIWNHFYLKMCVGGVKRKSNIRLYLKCAIYVRMTDGTKKSSQDLIFDHWSLFGFFIVVEVISHIDKK